MLLGFLGYESFAVHESEKEAFALLETFQEHMRLGNK